MGKLLAVIVLSGAVLSEKTCTVGFGSGSTDPSNPSAITLNVPFFYQIPFYCGPASIEMWAAYDGMTVTQQDIANYIGCAPNGSTAGQILAGVQHFTTSGRDASLLFNGGVGSPSDIAEQFYSAEITSISARIPVLPIVNSGLHAGILAGGQWHIDLDNNLFVWDSVFFHDPAAGPLQPFTAAQWTGYDSIEHIVSASATATAAANAKAWASQVAIRGSKLGSGKLPY